MVLDADDLQKNPAGLVRAYCRAVGLEHRPDALQWRQGAPRQWKVWESWHQDAAQSTEISTSASQIPLSK